MKQLLRIKRRALAAAVASALGLGMFAINGHAQTSPQTATLNVSANVPTVCTISTSDLNFPDYNTVAGTAVDGTGTVTITCTSGASATVTLGEGANAAGGSTPGAPLRQMKKSGGTAVLSYNLYTAGNHATVWNNTTGVTRLGTGVADPLTVFGRINASQNVPAGLYADTVQATVTF